MPSIIKQVHVLVTLDNMPQGLKITNKSNNVIFNYAWIVRVHYDEEIFDYAKYNEEEEDANNKENDSDN